MLAPPDFARPFKLEVDACGAGAVLHQDQHGVDHPKKKFNVHQQRYSTIQKEALSLLFALQHFEVRQFQPLTCDSLYQPQYPGVLNANAELEPKAHEMVSPGAKFHPGDSP